MHDVVAALEAALPKTSAKEQLKEPLQFATEQRELMSMGFDCDEQALQRLLVLHSGDISKVIEELLLR